MPNEEQIINANPSEALTLIQSKGWDAENLSRAQILWLGIKLRSTLQLMHDGTKAIGSIANAALKLRVVSDSKFLSNQGTCEECDFFTTGSDDQPACLACQCQGRGLKAKWRDARQHCPLTVAGQDIAKELGGVTTQQDPPRWDNRFEQSTTLVAADTTQLVLDVEEEEGGQGGN